MLVLNRVMTNQMSSIQIGDAGELRTINRGPRLRLLIRFWKNFRNCVENRSLSWCSLRNINRQIALSRLHETRTVQQGDPLGGLIWILMLPDPDNGPSRGLQPIIGVTITATIGLDLIAPILSIVFRPATMFWTAMPEATIHKHGQTRSCKDHVGGPAWSIQDHMVDAIT